MKLSCEVSSASSHQPTLFIHGNLASAKWWRPLRAQWQKLGPTGTAPMLFADWRGCGENEVWPIDKQFSLRDLAEDHLELLDQHNLQNVALVGHSLGGLIAQQMMAIAPSRFTRALLIDPVGARGVVFDDSMYEAFRQMAMSPQLTRTVILSTILGADQLERHEQDDYFKDAYKAVCGIGSSVLEILKTVDLTDELKDVAIPTLILHGAKDTVIPPTDSQQLAKTLPNARLEILEQQGHCYIVENPREFTARARQWLTYGK